MRRWRSPEPSELPAWDRAFREISQGPGISMTCPVCGQPNLRLFYVRFSRNNRGGYWFWCSSCLRYEHGTGLVPNWWKDIPNISLRKLTPQPEWLEDHWPVERALGR